MKKKKIIIVLGGIVILLAASFLILYFLLYKNPEQTQASTPTTQTQASAENVKPNNETPTSSNNPEQSNDTQIDQKTIKITFTNQCGVDIGMLSVIDPVTQEQVNVDPIPANDSVSLQAQWPVDTKEFDWAIYNQDGELYMEGKTDLTKVKSSATIKLIGNKSVESLEETFD